MSDFSKTTVKRLLQLSKPHLVAKLVELSNYAEQQKTTNIILLSAIKELEQKMADNNEKQSKEQVNE
jgi:hypothetical protein